MRVGETIGGGRDASDRPRVVGSSSWPKAGAQKQEGRVWFVSPELRICIFDTPDEQSGDAVEKGLHASGVIASLGGGLAF